MGADPEVQDLQQVVQVRGQARHVVPLARSFSESGPGQALACGLVPRALTHAGRPELPWKRRSTAYTRQDLPRSWAAARQREHAAQEAGAHAVCLGQCAQSVNVL